MIRRFLCSSVALFAFLTVGCNGDGPSDPSGTAFDVESAPIDLSILDRSTLEDIGRLLGIDSAPGSGTPSSTSAEAVSSTPLETTAALFYRVLLLRDNGVIDSATAQSMLVPVARAHGWLVNGDEAKALVSFARFVHVVRALVNDGRLPPNIGHQLAALALGASDQLPLQIVFSRRPPPGGWEADMFIGRSDGSEITRVTGPNLNSGGDEWPRYSPDGTRIAFIRDRRSIYTIRPDGTDLRLVKAFPLQGCCGEHAEYLTWSPDGQRLAFTMLKGAHDPEQIYVINVDGSGLTQLTFANRLHRHPSWSPDGTRIVFVHRQVTSNNSMAVMNPDGSGMFELPTPTAVNPSSPTWSPDGTRILFTANGTTPPLANTELWTVKPDGSELIQWTFDGMQKTNPRWSPIGDVVLFHGTTATFEPNHIFTLRLSDMRLAEITSGAVYDVKPDWKPLPR